MVLKNSSKQHLFPFIFQTFSGVLIEFEMLSFAYVYLKHSRNKQAGGMGGLPTSTSPPLVTLGVDVETSLKISQIKNKFIWLCLAFHLKDSLTVSLRDSAYFSSSPCFGSSR